MLNYLIYCFNCTKIHLRLQHANKFATNQWKKNNNNNTNANATETSKNIKFIRTIVICSTYTQCARNSTEHQFRSIAFKRICWSRSTFHFKAHHTSELFEMLLKFYVFDCVFIYRTKNDSNTDIAFVFVFIYRYLI